MPDDVDETLFRDRIIDDLVIEVNVLKDDILDFINEINHDSTSVDDILSRLEKFRTTFRAKHYKLHHYLNEAYDEKYSEDYNMVIDMIRSTIRQMKDTKSDSIAQKKIAIGCEEEALLFQVELAERSLNELQKTWETDVKEATDVQLMRWKENQGNDVKSFNDVTEKYSESLKNPTSSKIIIKAKADLGKRYNFIISLKEKFYEDLTNEIDHRELNKTDLIKEAKLNIKLSKFSGYESPLDIYTFQSEFEKLYLRTTTKRLLPDLLINNHLSEPALSLVKHLGDISEIWARLKAVYGDTKILLSRKIASLNDIQSLSKSKDPGRLIAGISQIINLMRDLMNLASKHGIEKYLYYGDSLDTVYKLMGDARVTKWLEQSVEIHQSERDSWLGVIEFLEKELKVQQQRFRLSGTDDPPAPLKRKTSSSYHTDRFDNDLCVLCGSVAGTNDHVTTTGPRGDKIIQYFSCRNFVEKTPAQRLQILRKKGLCFQCLFPGAKWNEGKHEDGKCQKEYVCPHESHSRYPKKKHVLICEEHKHFEENQKILEKYKSKFISKNSNLPSFSKDINLSLYSQISNIEVNINKVQVDVEDQCVDVADQNDDVLDRGIYMFQSIKVNGEIFNIFFDTGCSDFIVSKNAVDRLGSYAKLISKIPAKIIGVGKNTTSSEYGIYRVKLPLITGETATLSGICLTDITGDFPLFPLKEAEKDLRLSAGPLAKTFPKVPNHIGGRIDFMIGIKYLRYHPKQIYQLPTGLTIHKSVFRGADGTTGIIGGPHESFSETQPHFSSPSFFSDISDIIMTSAHSESELDHYSFKANPLKSFEKSENAGSEISYRCISCRECKDCKSHNSLESISIKEEAEQALIESSVVIDTESCITTARLPVLYDPANRLAPNKSVALKIYQQQIQKLNKHENAKDRLDVIESEAKLQKLGYVDFVDDLPEHIQLNLKSNPIKNFIPWRAVWKPSSISTPCRLVFDASMATPSGYSLNDILAKGKNGLNKLQQIIIRWCTHSIGLHTDISKMYNTICLDERDWCLQRYLWHNNLDPSKPPVEKVIKTLIYGVRPSGNQAEYGLRKVAEMSSSEYPEASQIIQKDTYVDDCISGEASIPKAHKRADELETVVNRGGFKLKGVSFSRENPHENLSDGEFLIVAGLKWYPKEDLLSLNIGDLNFAKRKRGKKPEGKFNIIPTVLTKRHCASKVGEIYDLLGKTTPLTASFKIDLHDLALRKLDWDDPIPFELRETWLNNFQLMQDLKSVQFKRCIIPEDALSLEIETIETADASEVIACSAIYARIKRRNGLYHCQLIFSRSKILPNGISQPRGELIAAVMNVHTSEIVKKSLGKLHKSSIKLCDSQVVLHWIHNEEKPLKRWVRSRVIEIRRFSSPEDWFYVKSKNMIADIGTRKGVSIDEISQDSKWINGYQWMSEDQSNFPIIRISDLTFSQSELSKINEEILPHQMTFFSTKNQSQPFLPNEVKQYYEYSNYLIDPNRYRFSKVLRIMSFVLKFIRLKCGYSITKSQKSSESQDLDAAKVYFFRKCTSEIQHFLPESKYNNISTMKDGILHYTGRILNCDDVSITGKFTKVMKDLTATTFCVPLISKHSPVAYAIVNEAHWHNEFCSHRGIETTMRYILKEAYIFELRSIVKKFKKSCQRCRYLMKKTIEVSMGPLPSFNLSIAPAFYVCQIDLSGPYKAYSKHNKRVTIKIWLVVFCCCTTSSVSIKIMDDYSTSGFIQAFIRFSSDSGFPKILLCDEGSQLMKGCSEMKLNFKDTMNKLHKDVGVEFNTCPVGGHNFHGKVERKIKEINLSIEKAISNQRLSLLQWETLSAMIANSINNLPIAIRNEVSDFEAIDLLTPNRLRLGRNNERSPDGEMITMVNPLKILDENMMIFNTWFEVWLLHIPNFMSQRKWFHDDKPITKGDVVIFTKQESIINNNYQYGMVEEVHFGKDGKARRATIRFKNYRENKFRFTNRAVRSLVLIQSVDEIDIFTELATMACFADTMINNCN